MMPHSVLLGLGALAVFGAAIGFHDLVVVASVVLVVSLIFSPLMEGLGEG